MPARRNPRTCIVKGCRMGTSKGAHGYCGKHYQRVRRHGSPDGLTPESTRRENNRVAQPRLGKGKAYVKLHGRHEHRVAMERALGRRLRSDEIVHHVDGNPKNNRIENLRLTSRQEHAYIHNGRLGAKNARAVRRLAKKLTQRKLAEKFGVSQSLISLVLAGKVWRNA